MVLLRQLAAIFFLSSHCTVYTTVSFDFSIGPESIVGGCRWGVMVFILVDSLLLYSTLYTYRLYLYIYINTGYIRRVLVYLHRERGNGPNRKGMMGEGETENFIFFDGLFFSHFTSRYIGRYFETNPHNGIKRERERKKRGMSPVVRRNICLCRTENPTWKE